jgi:hypothetical protein
MYWEKIWQLRFFKAVTINIFYFMLFLVTAQAQEKEMSAETEVQSEKVHPRNMPAIMLPFPSPSFRH